MNIEELKLVLLKSNIKEFEKSLDNYDINEFDNFGNNILHYYIKESKELKLNSKTIISLLLDKGIGIDTKQSKGAFKRSPFHIAVFMKMKKIADFLIEKKAEIDSTDANGNTILMTAINFYRNETPYFVEKLIQLGANVYKKNNYDVTPIEVAHRLGENNEIFKFFPKIRK